MSMEKEALTNTIESDLAKRNRNWDKVDGHLADNMTDSDGAHGLKIEEGTWTPAIKNSGGGPYALSSASGGYYKIGKLVYVWFDLKSSENLGDPYYVLLSGVPFTPSININHAGVASSLQGAGMKSTHSIQVTSQLIYIYNFGTPGDPLVDFSQNDEIQGSFTYIA